MVRKYVPKVGPKMLFKYREEDLKKAVRAVKSRKMSIRAAATQFSVPKSTLSRHCLRGENLLKHGRPTALTKEEETTLSDGLTKCATWGFPLRFSDIKDIVQWYLNSKGCVEKRFNDNRPGKEWIFGFIERNQELALRLCENVKRSRIAVNESVLKSYFDNLEKSLEGVPPSNIVNFDETNFTDDPKGAKVFAKRGSRHVERVMDTSKTSTSVMMAVTGSGEFLPPYVIYKAVYVYPTWTENGLPNSRYGSNKSGWFDMTSFQDWFDSVCLPYLKNLPGPKAIIGDNLASHLSISVISKCEENDIRFILLPPNSTHLTQPLDVAVFGPLKKAWRDELEEWKKKNRGVLPKSLFPTQLKNTVQRLGNEKMKMNITAGFKACGIVPLERQQVLKRLPKQLCSNDNNNNNMAWCDALVSHLEKARSEETASTRVERRGKRAQIEPGKSVSAEELSGKKSESNQMINSLDDEDEEDDPGTAPETNSDNEASTSQNETDITIDTPSQEYREKDFVLVKFTTEADKRTKLYMGRIENILECGTFEVKFLRKKVTTKETYFVFPEVPDIENTPVGQIMGKFEARDLRRGRLLFPTLTDVKLVN